MNSNYQNKAASRRKRVRAVAIIASAIAAVALPTTVQAFGVTNPIATSAMNTMQLKPYSSSPLTAVATDMHTGSARLSHGEQRDLLSQAVELRRLRNVEKEIASSLPSSRPTTLQLSRASGYGDDIHAFEDAVRHGHVARETLVTSNMGLVHHCVSEVLGQKQRGKLQSLSREDLIQEGAIGLARAVDRWNPEIGGKFSTYAYYWIRAAVLRCIAERDELVRVPEHVSTAVRKMTRAAQSLGVDVDGEIILSAVYSNSDIASWKEAKAAKALAEEAGLSEKQLREAIKVQQRRRSGVLSFESWMQRGVDFESDLVPVATEADSAALSLRTDDLKNTMSRFLRPKELEALCWRYGLTSDEQEASKRDYVAEAEEELFGSRQGTMRPPVQGKWGEAMSFVEVGKRMKVSAEYGRRLCNGALEKLRRAAEEGSLPDPAFMY